MLLRSFAPHSLQFFVNFSKVGMDIIIQAVLATFLVFSALFGLSCILYVSYKMITGKQQDYYCPTDRIDPEQSHGNAEPHL